MIMTFILACILSFVPEQTLRIPCILVEFKDVRFQDDGTKDYFDKLLNQDDYSEAPVEGSVKDYFRDNSLGTFAPVFDVYGPVTLNKYRAYYGRDEIIDGVRADAAVDYALAEACHAVDSEVDFSIYDSDSDGIVDAVLIIYAGYDQSQGGPSESIWAHQSNLSESKFPDLRNLSLDGVGFDSYMCASQYRGRNGGNLSGIGIICHEFGHVMGLPDFYDSVSDGVSSSTPGEFSLMCNGFSNGFGFVPPYLCAEERMILGWLGRESLSQIVPGHQVLSAIRNNTAYSIPGSKEGEYFILEYRDSKDWDSSLPEGLVVYHVDRSEEYLTRWENWRQSGNGINDDPQHPCFYIIPSYCDDSPGNMVFPGLIRNRCFEPVCWDGEPSTCQLTNIEITDEGLSLYAQFDCGFNVNGYVKNSYGDPIDGATVTIGDQTCVSSDGGHFMIPVPEDNPGPFTLFVSAPSFRDFSTLVSMNGARAVSVPVTLRTAQEGDQDYISKYDNQLARGYYSTPGIGAVRFSPSELAPYVGNVIKEISFYPYLLPAFDGEIYVTVDIGSTRVLTRKLETPVYGTYFKNCIDVEDAAIVIPEGMDVYVGYGCKDSSNDTFFVGTVYPGEEKNSYWSPFDMDTSSWSPMFVERAGIVMNLALETLVAEQTSPSNLSALGYTYIKSEHDAWMSGDSFGLEIVCPAATAEPQVKWYFDGNQVFSSVILESGHHYLEAHVTYKSGLSEIIRKEFNIR